LKSILVKPTSILECQFNLQLFHIERQTTQSSFTNCWWWCGGWFKTAAC